MQPEKLSKLCEQKSKEWDHRLYFKKHHSNGMCVKVLFEILSQVSPVHEKVYNRIKNIIWSHYIVMINGTGLVEEFEKYGMRKIKDPVVGAFIFIRSGNLIGHLGLCVDKYRFWHLNKHGFTCDDISDANIAYIGVF